MRIVADEDGGQCPPYFLNMDRRQATWQTASPEETFAYGELLGRCLVGGMTIGLVGPLGAGKTQLVKGIAAGNAVGEASKVTSPTFTLVHEHPGRLLLYHVDAYRLVGPWELTALGFDEMIRNDSAVAVEWADRVKDAIPDDALWIDLKPTGQTGRAFNLRATGDTSSRCLAALIENSASG